MLARSILIVAFILVVLGGYTYLSRISDHRRIEIFHGCGWVTKAVNDIYSDAFWKQLEEIERRHGGEFSDSIRNETLVAFDCGDSLLVHNVVSESDYTFGGVLYLKIRKSDATILEEKWG